MKEDNIKEDVMTRRTMKRKTLKRTTITRGYEKRDNKNQFFSVKLPQLPSVL